MQPTAPPGWYPDPQGSPSVRWFDGVQWTGHLAPAGSPAPLGAHPNDATHWLLPTGRSWQAITAGYLGIFAIFIIFLGPLAIGFGVWGLKVADQQGSHGRGRCVFGIIAGTWGTVITAILVLQSL